MADYIRVPAFGGPMDGELIVVASRMPVVRLLDRPVEPFMPEVLDVKPLPIVTYSLVTVPTSVVVAGRQLFLDYYVADGAPRPGSGQVFDRCMRLGVL